MLESPDNSLLDGYLQSLKGIKAALPAPFFYTRLRARMQERLPHNHFSVKPAWAVIALSFFLTINIWMILQQKNIQRESVEKKSSVQMFAETYHLNSNSNY